MTRALPLGRTDVVTISRVQLGVAPGGCGSRDVWVGIDFPNKLVSRGDYYAECVDAGDPQDAGALDAASADAGSTRSNASLSGTLNAAVVPKWPST